MLHLAAQSLVTRSYREPVLTFQTNVMGTVHVMEAVRRTPSVRSVVIVTTDKCYENREWPWAYREDDTLGGYDPYSPAKPAPNWPWQPGGDPIFRCWRGGGCPWLPRAQVMLSAEVTGRRTA